MSSAEADPGLQERHHRAYHRKRLTRAVFTRMRQTMRAADERHLSGEGLRVELGAGVAPMKELYPEVISTDVVASPAVDRILDAGAMDLADGSVRVFYGQNCFHHFPDPSAFFQEVLRCAVPGGGAVLVEPYYGPLASFLYPRLFKTEGFDKQAPDWETDMQSNMDGANQALSYVVFRRDRERFEREFPGLQLVAGGPLDSWLSYTLSGGLNFPQLLPNVLAPLAFGAEKVLSPLSGLFGLHHLLVLRKAA
jgi:SAM-dependent methyltransferase